MYYIALIIWINIKNIFSPVKRVNQMEDSLVIRESGLNLSKNIYV